MHNKHELSHQGKRNNVINNIHYPQYYDQTFAGIRLLPWFSLIKYDRKY